VAEFGPLKVNARATLSKVMATLSRFSTWRFFSRERAKSECDWVVMSSVSIASQSSCFFREKWKTGFTRAWDIARLSMTKCAS
jgi:hypothetical protein